MRRRIFRVLAPQVAAGVMLTACSGDADAATTVQARVTISVCPASTPGTCLSLPVPEATITVTTHDAPLASATTGADGRADLSVPAGEGGELVVTAESPALSALLTASLARPSSGGSLSVTLTDPEPLKR
ncbi:hypothetical protein [Phytohabitans kaempferiae]|uniref:Lipoprotein n=1 Tax=Phytohabitans kaempferiae TaxID=1620943 RepID=A0ABV6MAI3_9ACTN